MDNAVYLPVFEQVCVEGLGVTRNELAARERESCCAPRLRSAAHRVCARLRLCSCLLRFEGLLDAEVRSVAPPFEPRHRVKPTGVSSRMVTYACRW